MIKERIIFFSPPIILSTLSSEAARPYFENQFLSFYRYTVQTLILSHFLKVPYCAKKHFTYVLEQQYVIYV